MLLIAASTVPDCPRRTIPGAANPLNIDCRDLHPLITRDFTLAF
jgi:hypothetical protein